jgi:hypothetical protein
MSIIVTALDPSPADNPTHEQRWHEVEHGTANRLIVTPEQALVVLDIPAGADDSKPLSMFTVAAYAAGYWAGAVRK